MRKIVKLLIPSLLIAILANGCSNIGEASLVSLSVPEVENGTILFKGDELSKDVHINSNQDWRIYIEYISDAKDWLIISPTYGKGGETVHIETKDFYTPTQETRNATLQLTCGDITRSIIISQKSEEIEIEVSPEILSLKNEGGVKEVLYIKSNTEWTSTYEKYDSDGIENWYKIIDNKKEGGQGNDSLQIVPTGSNNTLSMKNSTLIVYPKMFELKDSSDYPILFKRIKIQQGKKPDLYWEIPSDPKNKTVYFNNTGGKREVLIYSNVRWRKPEDTKQFKFEIEQDDKNPRLKYLKIEAIKNEQQTEIQEDVRIVVLDEEDKGATPEEPIHISQEPTIL